jgi:hypothetical protein
VETREQPGVVREQPIHLSPEPARLQEEPLRLSVQATERWMVPVRSREPPTTRVVMATGREPPADLPMAARRRLPSEME